MSGWVGDVFMSFGEGIEHGGSRVRDLNALINLFCNCTLQISLERDIVKLLIKLAY